MENEPQDAYLPNPDEEIVEPFDVREQSISIGMLKLVGGFAVLLILAFVVLKLFASGTRDRDQTPRILADNAPYKEVPLERGGEQTPNQDKEIYQVLNGTKDETIIKTVPVTEQPLPKPQPLETTKSVTKPAVNVVIKEATTSKPKLPLKSPLKSKEVKPKPLSAPISGNYVVQVAALRSQKDAEIMWTKLRKNMAGIVTSSHFADIKRVDLGSRGIYYRLRVNGLANKAAATRLCTQLKIREQECIVTPK